MLRTTSLRSGLLLLRAASKPATRLSVTGRVFSSTAVASAAGLCSQECAYAPLHRCAGLRNGGDRLAPLYCLHGTVQPGARAFGTSTRAAAAGRDATSAANQAGVGENSDMPVIELEAKNMRRRRAARVLVLDTEGRVLLFEYSHAGSGSRDALADKGSYYTTPGGKADDGESLVECARRELAEETGITDAIEPRIVATRTAPLLLPSGEFVLADEQYFAVHVDAQRALDTSQWTESEVRNIKAYHWSTPADLEQLVGHNLWPDTLPEIVVAANWRGAAAPPLDYPSTQAQIGDVIVKVKYD